MKFSFRELLMMKTFVDQAQRENERKEVNPEYKKPRILPIVIGLFGCSFFSAIGTIGNFKTLVTLADVASIVLCFLLLRALIKRFSKR